MPEVSTQYYLGDSLIKYVALGNDLVASNPFTQNPSSPSIVTDGLIFYVNSQLAGSYPGSGTSIYNLSTLNTTGSMYNGVVWDGKYFQTNGTNQYIDWQPGTTLDLSSGTYTYMGASRYADTSGNGRMIADSGNGASPYVNWILGNWSNSTENYYADGTVYGIPGGANDTNWRIYTGTQNTATDNWKFYINNNAAIADNSGGASGTKGFNIGRYGNSSEYSSGSFAFLLVYNRVLTTTEISQNYDALKGYVNLT